MAQCERHGLAVGPQGRCALCNRNHRANLSVLDDVGHRRARRLARWVLAIVAGIAAFALLLALLDTR